MLLNVAWESLHANNRHHTCDRWVMALPPRVRAANPALYWMAGNCLTMLPDRAEDAFAYLNRSESLGLTAGDEVAVNMARDEWLHHRFMLYGPALTWWTRLRPSSTAPPRTIVSSNSTLGNCT